MKKKDLSKLLDENGVFSAIAIDQRGALKKLLKEYASENNITSFKSLVSEKLTPYGSSILLDPEYGLEAAQKKDDNSGLILSYEQTGYEKNKPGRLPRLIENQSVQRLKEIGADAIKILIYYDFDEPNEINDIKKAFVERVGTECETEELPFLLEILTYDSDIKDEKSPEFAKLRPSKVIRAMSLFSEPRYKVDVLKIETPVNMNHVEDLGDKEVIYSQKEASQYFEEQNNSTNLPYIFLSGGITADLFNKSLKFAKDSGSKFNGVLCGRATWKGATETLVTDGWDASEKWLVEKGLQNLQALNEVNQINATPIK
ncbi:tagatose 1,6-diphosphate aldolase [Staphylococcus equorum]|uniref:tagatose 1,6-diphosphate aldolase n=1 Tax=Staphylococcus equorum TaxID=246432 RepID=UPI0008063A58|nr:tagatose 1,6-diphosphate aldolase [Staphylococcus equorum]ANQ65662.1 tagatose-bisphosphate aldolase [Staphylococcus equorum]